MSVYILENDFSHLCDMSYDIALLPFEGAKSLRHKIRHAEKVDLPKELLFLANFNVVKSNSDYPIVNDYMPVMSNKMIEVLKGVGDFQCRIYPAVLIDDTFHEEKFINGKLKSGVPVLRDFALVQMLYEISGFDYDKSIYEPMNEWEKFPTIVSKIVIKEPNSGFPTIFRLIEKPSEVFVSQKAKDALENAGIKGCVFKLVETS